MIRCAVITVLGCVAAASAGAQTDAQGPLPVSEQAQAQANAGPSRHFSATALRGALVVVQPPQVLLNDVQARLAPGARIRGEDNLLVLSGRLVNRHVIVNYTLDFAGQLHDVWILTPSERARHPWPTTREQARAWRFNAATQTWTHP